MRALLLLLTTSAAFANDAAILRCRELSDPSLRLACYDSVAVPATARTQPRQTPDQFGMEHQGFNRELEAIESHIEGRFDGWGPKDNIQFANGQIWQISDDSGRVLNSMNPKIRVRRGALGAFYLEIEGTNHSPRVKRVR
jgi:hypothetical protein